MKVYRFNSNTRWGVFAENDEWGNARPADIAATLDSVKLAFEKYINSKYINSFSIPIMSNKDNPIFFREPTAIFLSATDRHWCKFVYQFAHELCHTVINADIPTNLRWFEESICQTASFFFLIELSKIWKISPPYQNWYDYADKMYSYYEISRKSIPDVSPLSKKDFFNGSMYYLSNNCYERTINTLLANEILPIFLSNPLLWQDIILLGKIPPNLSFINSIKVWKNLATNKSSINEIINIFED